ncbi:MAG: DUF1232 domain-containing protein [Anaerolineae bacterium]|nr:DUF1232 domain-containing protein [Anaerolineae bacterium]
MARKNRSTPDRSMLQKLFDRLVLAWRLLGDGRVSLQHKLIPPIALLYLLSPIDLVPEALLGPLGVFDDIGVVILLLETFIRMAPPGVVREHLEALQQRVAMSDDDTPRQREHSDVIDGQFRVKDEDLLSFSSSSPSSPSR